MRNYETYVNLLYTNISNALQPVEIECAYIIIEGMFFMDIATISTYLLHVHVSLAQQQHHLQCTEFNFNAC